MSDFPEYEKVNLLKSVDIQTSADTEVQSITTVTEKDDETIHGVFSSLKFFYCESLGECLLAKRVGNFYYARWDNIHECWIWCMSKSLPWGRTIEYSEAKNKFYTYPSEPYEIDFGKWWKLFRQQIYRASNTPSV